MTDKFTRKETEKLPCRNNSSGGKSRFHQVSKLPCKTHISCGNLMNNFPSSRAVKMQRCARKKELHERAFPQSFGAAWRGFWRLPGRAATLLAGILSRNAFGSFPRIPVCIRGTWSQSANAASSPVTLPFLDQTKVLFHEIQSLRDTRSLACSKRRRP